MTAERRAALDALAKADAPLLDDIDTTAVKRRAALVGKVRRAFVDAVVVRGAGVEKLASIAIDLISAETLEEAARVAGPAPDDGGSDDYRRGRGHAQAAIRALKET